MLRKFAFCAACLAVRGVAPVDCFAFPSRATLGRRSRHENGSFHEGVARSGHQRGTRSRQGLLPLLVLRARIVPYDSNPHTDCRHRGDGLAFDDPAMVERGSIGSVEAAAAEAEAATEGLDDEGALQQPESLATSFVTSSKTLFASAILGCSVVLAAASALPHPACASSAATLAETDSPTIIQRPSTRKDRPPPPEVPPGRITIVQWCARERDRLLPSERDLQAAVEKMQGDKGPAPSAEDMRRMAVDAQRSLNGLFMDSIKGGKKGLRSTQVASLTTTAVTETEAPQDEVATPKSAMQEEIDALKAEMLNLQAQPAQQSSGAAAATAELSASPRRDTAQRVTSALPSYKTGVPTAKPTQDELATGRAGRDKPAAPRKDTRRGARRTYSLAVDLKAELRAESEKAAAQSSEKDSGLAGTSSRGGRLQNAPSSVSASKVSIGAAVAGRRGGGIPSPSGAVGELDDVTTAGQASVAGTTLQRAADQIQDIAGQVKDLADNGGSASQAGVTAVLEQVKDLAGNGGSASQAGVAAVLEQGRASVDRLQAEADRISAGLSGTTAPLADKLSTGVSKLPETGRKVGSRLSEISGRVTARVADSAKGAATVGTTAAGGLSGALRVGTDTILPKVTEAGRVVGDGVSALSKNAVDGLPGVKDQASVMSSQIVDASTEAASRATDAISAGAGDLWNRFSDLSDRGPELAAWANNAMARLRTLGGGFAGDAAAGVREVIAAVRGASGSPLSGEENDDVVLAAAAAAAAVVGAAVVARSAGTGESVPGREGGEDEGGLLQPIGVTKERASESDGERYGADAVSATGTLWDMIRDSGTAAGDGVREVSEEDLLARAVEVGDELRETSEGLEVLKEEVMSLRESIRESDLEGKADALREALASALEGSVVD